MSHKFKVKQFVDSGAKVALQYLLKHYLYRSKLVKIAVGKMFRWLPPLTQNTTVKLY